jgi:hypothetical protein
MYLNGPILRLKILVKADQSPYNNLEHFFITQPSSLFKPPCLDHRAYLDHGAKTYVYLFALNKYKGQLNTDYSTEDKTRVASIDRYLRLGEQYIGDVSQRVYLYPGNVQIQPEYQRPIIKRGCSNGTLPFKCLTRCESRLV